jgi:hypothetical protein
VRRSIVERCARKHAGAITGGDVQRLDGHDASLDLRSTGASG